MRVVVLSTSYPRNEDDAAGKFVADAVAHVREAGIDVDVVSPATFPHFGIAYGGGIVQNLRAAPWKVALLPAFMAAFTAAARRAARDADVVHAHWLPSGIAAAATGKPFVLQVWGTDVELARRVPRLARVVLRRAALVVAGSSALAKDAIALGANEVRVIPAGVALPDAVAEPEEPPHVLYAGRLSAEKGILELIDAAKGMPLVVVGDGPLRGRVPQARGFVSPSELGAFYERAAVVAVPSHREGYGVVAREAMAYARAVVVTSVGGLTDAVEDGVSGLHVPPRDVGALRAALERLLADAELRGRLGAAARDRAARLFSWSATTRATLDAYADAARRTT